MTPDPRDDSGEFTPVDPGARPEVVENDHESENDGEGVVDGLAAASKTPSHARARGLTDDELQALAGRDQSEVVRDHRTNVARAQELVRRLFVELSTEHERAAEVETLLTDLRAIADGKEDMSGLNRIQHRLDRVVTAALPARAAVARSLTAALKELVTIERIAHGLEAYGGEGESDGSILPIAERIAQWERDDELDDAFNVTRLPKRGTLPAPIRGSEAHDGQDRA